MTRPNREPRIRLRSPGRIRLVGVLALATAAIVHADVQHNAVATTVHNLSISGPGEVHSLTETQICKFCHVPHSAVVPEALWGHVLSKAEYKTPTLRRGRADARVAPQPDGSSRLCLSCHDGTVALGDVAGEPRRIAMAHRERLRPGDRGYLGTDLSGSHPISFTVEEHPRDLESEGGDVGLRPLAAIRTDPDVRLDGTGKMQCTTCHDPHSDRFYKEGEVPRFWVKPTVDEVCRTCHVVR
ncbi:MAG: cytochrome c3 family protein [Thermoanaerobaculia bacterium]|nr:MAG: cytochrome c3 family protein [Thermoanaerobaculia bacterium]